MTEKHREHMRRYAAAYRSRRRAEGLCIKWGCPNLSSIAGYCSHCYERVKASNNRWRRANLSSRSDVTVQMVSECVLLIDKGRTVRVLTIANATSLWKELGKLLPQLEIPCREETP